MDKSTKLHYITWVLFNFVSKWLLRYLQKIWPHLSIQRLKFFSRSKQYETVWKTHPEIGAFVVDDDNNDEDSRDEDIYDDQTVDAKLDAIMKNCAETDHGEETVSEEQRTDTQRSVTRTIFLFEDESLPKWCDANTHLAADIGTMGADVINKKCNEVISYKPLCDYWSEEEISEASDDDSSNDVNTDEKQQIDDVDDEQVPYYTQSDSESGSCDKRISDSDNDNDSDGSGIDNDEDQDTDVMHDIPDIEKLRHLFKNGLVVRKLLCCV